MEVLLGEGLLVAHQEAVRRHHHVARSDLAPLAVPREAREDDRLEVRREARDLARPVADQARGRHDQRRVPVGAAQPAFGLLDAQVRDGLERLPQAHVVGQDAADAAGAQVLEEGHALLLVGAERGAQLRRRRDRARAVGQREGAPGDVVRIAPGDLGALFAEDLVEPREGRGARLREGQLALFGAYALVELDHHVHQRAKAIARERDVVGAADGHRVRGVEVALQAREPLAPLARPLDEVHHDGQEIDPLAVHLHAELEAEPVGQVVEALDGGVPRRVGGLDHAERVIGGDVHAEAELAQLGQRLRREGAVGVRVSVDPHHVVGLAIGRRGEIVDAVELDGAQALEGPPCLHLALAIAGRIARAGGAVGGAHDDAVAVVEGELDQRDRLLVMGEAEALLPGPHHRLGVEPDGGYESERLSASRCVQGNGLHVQWVT